MNERSAAGSGGFHEVGSQIQGIMKDLCIGDEYLWNPDRLVPLHHWAGHIPFAFWLMSVMRPTT